VGEETMVTSLLTKDMIKAGETLVRKLDKRGLRPDSAFWLYLADTQEWKLVIAEAKVSTEGPRELYRIIQSIIATSKGGKPEVSLDTVTLTKSDAAIVSLLKAAIRTGPGISGIRFKNNVINGTVIDDAYIYRLT